MSVQPIIMAGDGNGAKMTEVLQGVSKCPHCSKSDPFLARVWMTDYNGTPRGDGGTPKKWAAYRCASCGSLLVASALEGETIGSQGIPFIRSIFPAPPTVPTTIPPIPKRFLEQAMDTLHAPDAAAVMAGSAVDAMLKAKGYSQGSLYGRIDKAREDGLLTQGMADWAHSVRLGSNRPRHADADNPHVSTEEASRSVGFARALGDFLFVLTAQIQEAVESAAQT